MTSVPGTHVATAPVEPQVLAAAVANGDRLAEACVIRRYSARILAMAISRTHDREASAELVDDALMATLTALRLGRLRDPERLDAFVSGVALNVIRNFLRARRGSPRLEPLPTDLPARDTPQTLEMACDYATARQHMSRLSRLDRRVLLMGLYLGLNPGEIAALSGMTPAAVRQRKCRALKRPRSELNTGLDSLA